jgi:hypothetical protein
MSHTWKAGDQAVITIGEVHEGYNAVSVKGVGPFGLTLGCEHLTPLPHAMPASMTDQERAVIHAAEMWETFGHKDDGALIASVRALIASRKAADPIDELVAAVDAIQWTSLSTPLRCLDRIHKAIDAMRPKSQQPKPPIMSDYAAAAARQQTFNDVMNRIVASGPSNSTSEDYA